MTDTTFKSSDLMLFVLLMFIAYVVFFCIAAFYIEYEFVFHRKVEWYVEREFDAMDRLGLKVANCYWFIRCIFSKRWWQSRANFTLSKNYGMSWEGKEKEYHKRYASDK